MVILAGEAVAVGGVLWPWRVKGMGLGREREKGMVLGGGDIGLGGFGGTIRTLFFPGDGREREGDEEDEEEERDRGTAPAAAVSWVTGVGGCMY